MKARHNVQRFMFAIFEAAVEDASKGVPEYHKTNTRQHLLARLNLDQYRINPRNGDARCARSVYTAARWLLKTEEK